MATNTLLDYVTANEKALSDENALAQANLTKFQQKLATAQGNLATHTQNVTALEAEVATIRQQIAATANPADGKQLFDELTDKTIKIRSERALVTAAADAVARATSWIATAQDELDRTAALKQQATAAKVEIAAADTERTSWKNIVTSPPLAGLPTAADVTLPGPAKTAADDAAARLGGEHGDIPTKLFARGKERWQNEKAREDAVAKAAADAEDKEAGLTSSVDAEKLAFERSEAAIRDFALGAQGRYALALSLLEGVANAPALTAAEEAAIAAARDQLEHAAQNGAGNGGGGGGGGQPPAAPAPDQAPAAQDQAPAAANGSDAIDKQKERDDQQANVDRAQQTVDAAILDALAADPAKDPETVDAVKAARQELANQTGQLQAKEDAYEAVKADLDKLEAAIPDDTWARFEDYEEALAILDDLKNAHPDTLRTNLVNAEQTYAQALDSQRKTERAALAVGEEARRREDRLAAITASVRARLIAALRGDD